MKTEKHTRFNIYKPMQLQAFQVSLVDILRINCK
jgi:hypothetical protein